MEFVNTKDEEEAERKLLESSDGDSEDDSKESNSSLSKSNGDPEKMQTDNKSDSEDNDNESMDDEDDDKERAEAEANINAIKLSLRENPYNYDLHKNLIEQLQVMDDLDRLRAAREDMSSKYPLTPELWLAWLENEKSMAESSTDPNQKLAVVQLFERAVKDYLSVEIWLDYVIYSTGLSDDKESIENVRNIFEKALTAAGLHVTKGSLIWDAYREYEVFLAAQVDPLNETLKLEHINRIGKIYRRQLSCPLLDMDKTFKEYELWKQDEGSRCTEDPQVITRGYEKAMKQLEERLPFEMTLESSNNNKTKHLETYKTYLEFEKKNGDPGRITVLFERAITDFSLESSVWLDYIDYLQNNLKIEDIIMNTYNRSVRNVPWCVKIWQKYLRFKEKTKKPLKEIQSLVESALEAGFSLNEDYKNLWMSYLEYLRRYYEQSEDEKKYLEVLLNAFSKAYEHVASFGLEGDPTCEILQFWARVEAIHANNMEKARSLWADIMSEGHSESATSWLELISLERCYGDSKHLRKTFQKALNACKDWPESIANAWTNFERDEGTLEQMELCEEKVKERIEKVQEERRKAQMFSSQHDDFSANKKPFKRKADDGGKWQNLGPSAKKNIKSEVIKKSNKNFENESESKKVAPPPGYDSVVKHEKNTHKVSQPPGYRDADDKEQDHLKEKMVDENITVFVSNLDYDATEDQVIEALKSAGPVTLFKMVRDFKGRSKGFCYVQLTNTEAVEIALKLDRTPINGRPMFVSRCDPTRTQKQTFKYKTDLEKKKLFIKGLPAKTTKEDLENIFNKFSGFKEVRLVTYRNGHSKGMAYVDFDEESSASKALLETDNLTIDGKAIYIAISQPPERKTPQNEEVTNQVKSLGSSSKSRTHFGNPKTILSMVPRTVATAASKTSQVSNNGVTTKPMSNQDFRSMLLGKK